MQEVVNLINESIQDSIFSRKEKRDIKAAIKDQKLSKQELVLLRGEIFNVARSHSDFITKENLIDWLEAAAKIAYPEEDDESSESKGFFSPGKSVRSAIIKFIRKAEKNIKVCVFTICDPKITKALCKAHKRGVAVQIITDDEKVFDIGSTIDVFVEKGIPVKVDETRHHMHHKFCVIDDSCLLTGSYNWTNSAANYNQENLLVTSELKIVREYLGEFEKLWNQFVQYP